MTNVGACWIFSTHVRLKYASLTFLQPPLNQEIRLDFHVYHFMVCVGQAWLQYFGFSCVFIGFTIELNKEVCFPSVSFFLNVSIFNWRIISLQCCVGFYHSMNQPWYTYVPSLWNLLPLPPQGCHRALVWVPWVIQ